MILNVFGVFLSLVHIFIFFVLFYFFKGGNCVTSLQSSSMNTCPGQPPHWPYGFTGKARQEMGWPVFGTIVLREIHVWERIYLPSSWAKATEAAKESAVIIF